MGPLVTELKLKGTRTHGTLRFFFLITYGKYFSKQFPPFAIKLPESAELLLVIYTLYKLRKEKDVLFTK